MKNSDDVESGSPKAADSAADVDRPERPSTRTTQNGNVEPQTRRVINVAVLVTTIVTCAVLGTVVYFWHSYQVSRTVVALLARADVLEEDGDWSSAAEYLQRYRQLVPGDVAARIRFAKAYDKSAVSLRQKQRAIEYYFVTLGAAGAAELPAQQLLPLRGRLVELLVELHQYTAAIKQASILRADAERLLESNATDGEALRLRSLAIRSLAFARYGLFRQGDRVAVRDEDDSVGTAFMEALPFNRGDRMFALQLAHVCRRELGIAIFAVVPANTDSASQGHVAAQKGPDADSATIESVATTAPGESTGGTTEKATRQILDAGAREALADQTMDDMVALHEDDAQAFLARYRYRSEYHLAGAIDDLDKALELAPENLEVCLAAAERVVSSSIGVTDKTKVDELRSKAEAFYRKAVAVAGEDIRPFLALGRMCRLGGRLDEAREVYEQGLEKVGRRNVELNLRLAEVLIDSGMADETAGHIAVAKEELKRFARRLKPELRRSFQDRVDLLQGRVLVVAGKYREALPHLERVRTLGETSMPLEKHRHFVAVYVLGQCYAGLGRWEQAARLWDDAAALRPDVVALHRAAAEAWRKSGQATRGAYQLEQALKYEDSAELWFQLAEVRLKQQMLVLPRENRDWGPFTTALAEARKPNRKEPLSRPWRAGLLEVQCLVLRSVSETGRAELVEQARQVMSQLAEQYPDAAEMWVSLALIYQRVEDPESADRAYGQVVRLEAKGAARYLVRGELLAARSEFEAAKKVILDGRMVVSPTERRSLNMALVAIYLREGKLDQAVKQLTQLQVAEPKNVSLLQQLADLAFEQGDLKAVEVWEEKLHQIEGDAGLRWRYQRARRLLAQAKTANDASFAEARQLANELISARPGWPPAVLLSAMLYHRIGRYSEAIDAYQEAIRSGERRLSVYERLIMLLVEAGRQAEVEAYLGQLQEYVPVTEKLSGIEIFAAARRGHIDQAIQAAQRGAERRPDDPIAHIWLGQMLAVAGKVTEAEVAMRKAIQLAPDSLQTHRALLMLLLRNDRPADARKMLDQLHDDSTLPEAEKLFVMAQAYQQLDDRERAEKCYGDAVAKVRASAKKDSKSASQQSAILTRWALYVASNDPAKAETLLREAVAVDPQSGDARRCLAAILAAGGSDAQWAESQQLLAATSDKDKSTTLDKRLSAAMSVRRGGKENLAKARRLLEELLGSPDTATDTDRLLLARLHEAEAALLRSEARELAIQNKSSESSGRRRDADARIVSARKQYVSLAARSLPRVEHLGVLVQFLLRQKEYKEAQRWIDQLVKRAPDDLGVARLNAQVMHATGRTHQIPGMLEPVAQNLLANVHKATGEQGETEKLGEVKLALTVGGIYRAAELNEVATAWLRRAFDITPTAYVPLANCLAAEGRVSEAVQLCLDAENDDSTAKLPLALASLMVMGTASAEDFRQVDPILSRAVRKHPDDLNLLSAVASVRVVEGRLNDAVDLYQRILGEMPDNLVVLNNLATILAEQPDRLAAALNYIDRAIELSGPSPELLDSKGIILFQADRLAEAKTCLEAATWNPDADPRFFFHLAATYLRLNDLPKARETFQHAMDHNLEQQILTPSDQALLGELKKAVGGPKVGLRSEPVGRTEFAIYRTKADRTMRRPNRPFAQVQ